VAVCALTAFFCWGMASQAFGAVQDIGADREAGIGSIGTVLGAARTVRVALALYVAAGLVVLGTGWPGALAALVVVPYAHNVSRFLWLGDAEAEQAHAGWQRFLWLNYVTGFLLTQLFIWIAW
jgi:4-hydroxybenzoate polyprenyltransferase